MNRKQRRAKSASKRLEIEYVVVSGEDIHISSPKLDDFCNENGDLVLPDGKGNALVIEGWYKDVRRVPS